MWVIRFSSVREARQSVITQALLQPLLDAGIALDLGPVLEGTINRPEVAFAPSLVPPERVADALPHVLVVGR